MAAPDLSITVEPAEALSVVYGPLAAKTSNELPNGQLSLVLTIENNENLLVRLNQVRISFIGPPNIGPSEIIANTIILPLATVQWSFSTSDNILLPVPAPGGIKFELYCDFFDDPAELEMPLAPYESPADGGGYAFPAGADDLKKGEYWTGLSAAHGAAGGGTQLFAYDLSVRVYNPETNKWQTTTPGGDVTLNQSYRIWGKPIYAMADGVVTQFLDGMQSNTPPGFPDPTPSPVEGNHFYIQHGDDLALYAHLIAGTLNPELTSGPNDDGTGATVTKGQLLGLAGNSGRSSEPHLHIQVNRTAIPWGGPPRPLPFKGVHVLDLAVVDPEVWPPNHATPWNAVSAQALPSILSAIWLGKIPPVKGRTQGWVGPLTWAWVIFVGGLMITPGGISCPACGRELTIALGLVSIVLGGVGFASRMFAKRTAAPQRAASPQVNAEGDMHG